MDIVDAVSDVLARSPRVAERKALWAELAATFKNAGGVATTQKLADLANEVKSKFDATLRELGKKL